MSLEIALFMFLRSLREASFEICIKAYPLWMFALDHVHHARWLPVYLQDLENLYYHPLYHCANSFQMGILLSRRQLATFPTLLYIKHMDKVTSLLKSWWSSGHLRFSTSFAEVTSSWLRDNFYPERY